MAQASSFTSNSFFTFYCYDFFETSTENLTENEKFRLRIARIGLAILTIGILPTVCWLKWGERRIEKKIDNPFQKNCKHLTEVPEYSLAVMDDPSLSQPVKDLFQLLFI